MSAIKENNLSQLTIRIEALKNFDPYRNLDGGPVTMSGVARAISHRERYGGYKVQGLMPEGFNPRHS